MEHVTKAATIVATTDQGEFSAIIAAYSIDRVGDRIAFGAFAKTIAKWQESGKQIPLHWDHKGDPQYIIGSFDPATMEEIEGKGLVATGRLDLENSEMAREAWRAMKTGSMSLSFGYLVPEGMEKKGRDGINDISEIDLFEGTIAPAPVNADTQILSMKSSEELRDESTRLEREIAEARIPEIPLPDEPIKSELEKCEERFTKELQEVKAQLAEALTGLEDLKTKQAAMTDKEAKSPSVDDPLRKRSEELTLEVASGGMSLRKPPVVTEAKAEPVDHDAIRRESRDYMFEVLSYSTE